MFKKLPSCLNLVGLLTLGFCVIAWNAPACAATPTSISGCETVSTPGNFALTQNLTATGDCLTITASNVNIDLMGHTITGNGTGSGITGNNVQNVVINDGSISHFATGVNLTLSTCCVADDTIQNLTVSNNTDGGIRIEGCCNTFANVTTNSNGGIGLKNDDCCSTVTNVVANNNGSDGMDLFGCCYVVEKSTANGNGAVGVFATDCCTAVDDSMANNNQLNGLDLEGCCSVTANDTTNGNHHDGVFFEGCCGDDRGNNIAVDSTASNNGANGFEFTQLRNSAANISATKNANHGVLMTCPATESGIAASGNGSSNLFEDTSNGVCTDLNNKAS